MSTRVTEEQRMDVMTSPGPIPALIGTNLAQMETGLVWDILEKRSWRRAVGKMRISKRIVYTMMKVAPPYLRVINGNWSTQGSVIMKLLSERYL